MYVGRQRGFVPWRKLRMLSRELTSRRRRPRHPQVRVLVVCRYLRMKRRRIVTRNDAVAAAAVGRAARASTNWCRRLRSSSLSRRIQADSRQPLWKYHRPRSITRNKTYRKWRWWNCQRTTWHRQELRARTSILYYFVYDDFCAHIILYIVHSILMSIVLVIYDLQGGSV